MSVCDMCICMARGGVGGIGDEWVRGLDSGFNPGGTGGSGICVCVWLRWCGWSGGRFESGSGRMGGVKSVFVVSLMTGPSICILC